MPTQDSATPGGTFPAIQMPSGQEIYDLIMGAIEPELTSAEVKNLKERYKGENAADAKVRAARYEQAFKEYNKRLEEFSIDWNLALHLFESAARETIEGSVRADDVQQLDQLSSAMRNS